MLPEEEQAMIRGKYEEGMTITAISRDTGLDRKTVRKYAQTDKVKTSQSRRARGTILEPHKKYIRDRLKNYPLTAKKLYREIQKMGYKGKYGLVKNYTRKIRKDVGVQAEYRYETPPGQQSQVDWGHLGKQFLDGKWVNVYAFCMVLGYSRTRYLEITTDVRTETFIRCHINAFEFYKGYTRTILYDNTKNVVLERAIYGPDSKFNPMFLDFFNHYGFTPHLCKPGISGAKTKGKVEALVKYVKKDYFLGETFDSLTDMNRRAREWMDRVNSEPHGTTHVPPIDRFPEEDLLPLDRKTPFQIVKTEFRKISRDCFVTYLNNRYSVPWEYAGREAKLIIQNDNFSIHVDDRLICEHEINPGNYTVVRNNEHFKGLLSAIKARNHQEHVDRLERITLPNIEEPEVENRDLHQYDMFMGGIP